MVPKLSRIPCTFRPSLENGRGFTRLLGVAGLGYRWGKKGPKLRSVGESLLQKFACESGEVAQIVNCKLSENHSAGTRLNMHDNCCLSAKCTVWTIIAHDRCVLIHNRSHPMTGVYCIQKSSHVLIHNRSHPMTGVNGVIPDRCVLFNGIQHTPTHFHTKQRS